MQHWRYGVALLGLLFGAAQAQTLVQATSGGHVQWDGSSATSQPLAFGSSVTQGNDVVCLVAAYHASDLELDPATDTASNTYALVAESDWNNNGFAQAFIWHAKAATGGFTTVTINGLPGGGLYGQAICTEWAGLAPMPVDQTCTGGLNGPTSTDANCTLSTLSQADELVIAVMANSEWADTNANISGPSGGCSWTNIFREQDSLNHSAGSGDYCVVSATTGFTVQYSHDNLASADTDWGIAAVTLIVGAEPTFPRSVLRGPLGGPLRGPL